MYLYLVLIIHFSADCYYKSIFFSKISYYKSKHVDWGNMKWNQQECVMTRKLWDVSLQLRFLHSFCQVLHTLPWKREDHAACFPFLTLSNSDSASCSADFSIDTLCSSSSTVPLFRADLYGVRKSREKFCKAWTPQTWKTHLQALTHIVNWNKQHCGLPDYLPLLKVRAAWWCWSHHITYGTDQYISVAFLFVLLAVLTQQLPPIKVSTLNQQQDWKCPVRCSGSFFLKYKFSRSFR